MKIGIEGIGLWGQGLTGWPEFQAGLDNGFAQQVDKPPAPTPAGIPARERRRAPLSVKLAIECINQAASMAGLPEQDMCSVFASAMGDSHITDYVCKTLADNNRALSPTKFHNSVNNAASGYWSISTGNRLPSSFISGFRNSFPVALLEAAALAISEDRPTALAIYDVAFGNPLFDICPSGEDFAAAFVLTPTPDSARWILELEVEQFATDAPKSPTPFVQERMHKNPSASALTLCEMLGRAKPDSISWPLGTRTSLVASQL